MTISATARRDDSHERARLHALHALQILDTDPEPRLQVLVDRAARVFRVPMAALCFLDRDRLWVKSAVGFDGTQMPRHHALCEHLLPEKSTLVVCDAQQDPRFAQNPFVAGPPFIRFYAGVALRSACGYTVGSLCVFDVVPRAFDEVDRQTLIDMANYAANELMMRSFVGGGCSVV